MKDVQSQQSRLCGIVTYQVVAHPATTNRIKPHNEQSREQRRNYHYLRVVRQRKQTDTTERRYNACNTERKQS